MLVESTIQDHCRAVGTEPFWMIHDARRRYRTYGTIAPWSHVFFYPHEVPMGRLGNKIDRSRSFHALARFLQIRLGINTEARVIGETDLHLEAILQPTQLLKRFDLFQR